jgi:hypothetical protein
MLLNLQILFSKNLILLLQFVFSQGYEVTMGEVWRSPEQAMIYFKEGKGIVHSQHCKRLAVDLNLQKNGKYITDTKDYEIIGKYWETLDHRNRWGGHFPTGCRKDLDHFEMRDNI